MDRELSCTIAAAIERDPDDELVTGDQVEFQVNPGLDVWVTGTIDDIEYVGPSWVRHPRVVYWIEKTVAGSRRMVYKRRGSEIRKLHA